MKPDLSQYRPEGFNRGVGPIKEALWLIISLLLFRLCPVSLSVLKCAVLRAFGAKVGHNVVIKPDVQITFPWKLSMGDHVWLGESCWLLNLEPIVIESHVCISQRAFLCTGNHDFTSATFALRTAPIHVESGVWIAASAWVGPGVRVGARAVLSACSMTAKDLSPDGIYQGNPAVLIRQRLIS